MRRTAYLLSALLASVGSAHAQTSPANSTIHITITVGTPQAAPPAAAPVAVDPEVPPSFEPAPSAAVPSVGPPVYATPWAPQWVPPSVVPYEMQTPFAMPYPPLARSRSHRGVLAAGIALFAATSAINVLGTVLCAGCRDSWLGIVPAIGPWVLAGEQGPNAAGFAELLVIDGIVQAAGLVLLAVGAHIRAIEHRRSAWTMAPTARAGQLGAGVAVTF